MYKEIVAIVMPIIFLSACTASAVVDDDKKQRAIACIAAGVPEQATPIISKEMQKNSKDPDLYVFRSETFLRKLRPNNLVSDCNMAIKDCDSALELDPNNIAAKRVRALAKLRKGEEDSAFADLKELPGSDADVLMLITRACANYRKSNCKEALSDAEKALSINKKFSPAADCVENIFLAQGENKRAEYIHSERVELDSKDNERVHQALSSTEGPAELEKLAFEQILKDEVARTVIVKSEPAQSSAQSTPCAGSTPAGKEFLPPNMSPNEVQYKISVLQKIADKAKRDGRNADYQGLVKGIKDLQNY
jgi:tetratricopeptide (TPR) repeat protein